MDGKHCTLPHLTGKTFVYNAAEERLELCVDTAGHFPVGPDVEELVKEALVQLRSEAATRGSREGSPSHGVLRLGSGGVVRKKEQLQSVTAFQGKGHSLGSAGGSPPPEHRPITRQHSSGVDLSASVSRGPPDLSDIPEDTTRELVRMAPGFVTMKDSRGLDPSLMEQQRRKLQEMVSSIQASMERHLREQQSGASQEQTGGTKSGTGQPTSTASHERPAAAGASLAGRPDGKAEEPEEMESQDAEQSNTTEPMDHS
ncbi:deubiquitinating protein VCPIP1-like [Xiphias gladius]|uniref:deubiquitinating protein VCPIP1-like n=1 Tax=Xiphias gladius TaxID=8245 RepID=UPI001A9A0879|nr:deubiquitinating protein VCPIP1-like [Xiphias gladius]